jgi:hypothetical protein
MFGGEMITSMRKQNNTYPEIIATILPWLFGAVFFMPGKLLQLYKMQQFENNN